MTIRRDGSEDECDPNWDADCRPDLPEDWPSCDAGHPGCTGHATQVLNVEYLKAPLHVCDNCAAYEQKKIDDGPSDEYAGGLSYGPHWQDEVNRSRR